MLGEAVVDLSLILPVHDEVESLPRLWLEIEQMLWEMPGVTEIVFVDDASTDGSADVLRDLVNRDKRVRLIRLARRGGLTAAFQAGFAVARGAVVATMDTDLQNDPRDLPRLLDALSRHDAVVGWRRARRDPWLKRVSSRVANGVRDLVTGDRVHDSASSLRVMRRPCLAAIPPYHGMHRFVPTLLRVAGHRVVEVPVAHRPRRFGRSKYGVRNRLPRALADVLAVRWMMRRQLRYEVVEEASGG